MIAVPFLLASAAASILFLRSVATDGGRTRELEARVGELQAELERRDADD